jgi:predicted lipoprotein with Yx(FWY)xxD motif
MTIARRATIPMVVLALVAAACGHSGSSSTSNSGQSSGASMVKTANVSGVGTVLVNSSGMTLYMLSADKGGKVTCASSPCTGIWPPLLVSSTPTAGSGVTGSLLGTASTPSGMMQATYNKWPLYTYSGDSSPGQANGQGIRSFGGVWHPLAASGQPVSGSGGGRGY